MIRKNLRFLFSFVAIFALQVLTNSEAFSQARLVEGEKVRVLALGGWRDGIVLETKGKQAKVSYNIFPKSQLGFNSDDDDGFSEDESDDIQIDQLTKREAVFTRNNIRKLCELKGIDFARSWTTADGQYQVIAALQNVEGDKVVLVKEDLTIVKVPLATLSAKDKGYAKKQFNMRKAAIAAGRMPAITPTLPSIQDFETLDEFYREPFEPSNAEVQPFGATPPFLKFSESGLGFNLLRASQEVVSVLPVGGPQELLLVGARENDMTDGNGFQTQLYWLSMKEQKVLGNIAITAKSVPVDYNPMTKTLLTVNTNGFFDDGNDPEFFTLWRLLPGKTDAMPLICWSANFKSRDDHALAKIVNNEIVMAKLGGDSYVAWNLKERRQIYKIKLQGFRSKMDMTPDRKMLIGCEEDRVTIFNAIDGKIINQFSGKLKVEGYAFFNQLTGANVNSTGTKLAAVNQMSVMIWDLAAGERKPKICPAPFVAGTSDSQVSWIDDDLILVESHMSKVLFRVSLGLPVWSYDLENTWGKDNRLNTYTVDSKYFYNARPHPAGTGGRFEYAERGANLVGVGIVNLPGPKVNEITKNIDPDSLNILKPGTRVGLKLSNVTNPEQVRIWFTEKIKEAGWILDNEAPIKVIASMGIGQAQKVEYQTIGSSNVFSVNFRPHYSKYQIKDGKRVLWQNSTSSRAPSMIQSNNPRAAVGRYQQPNLEFFRRQKFPKKVLDPKYARGFGVSQLSMDGIKVLSTNPPGRASDPDEALRKAEEDEKKRLEKARKDRKKGKN